MVFPGGAVCSSSRSRSKGDIHWCWFDLARFCILLIKVQARRNTRLCLRALLKAGRVGMEDRWCGIAFQIFEATDENDLEAAMVVYTSRGGTHEDTKKSGVVAPAHILGWEMKGSLASRLLPHTCRSVRCGATSVR